MFDYSQYAKRLQLTIQAPCLLLLGLQALTASTAPPEAGGDVRGGDIESQFSSVAQSRPTLCEPMDCSTPGLPVHHQLLELAQTHVHHIGDAIQTSILLFPSPPALNRSQHQGLFQWVSSSHQVAKVLEFQLSISPSNEYSWWSPLEWTGWISLQSKGLSGVFSNTTVQKHQFLGTQLSL